MTTMMQLPAADLIPGDVLIPKGETVTGYPHGTGTLPGTLVPYVTQNGLSIWRYYGSPETPVTVLRD